jgi:phage-related protein
MGKRVTYAVHEANFGEGYQTRLSVINNKGQTLDLSFGMLTQIQADDIEDFLDSQAGAKAFLYGAPGFGGVLPWVCKEWRREHQGLWFRITAAFVRVFDVASLSGGGDAGPTGITVLRQTAAQWSSENPLLDDGVFAIETDTDLYKIGNGVSVWTSLPYMRAPLPGNQPVAHVEQRTAAAWRTFDPIMSDQTVGYEIDTHRAKIGDGSTRWLNLPYLVTDGDSIVQAYAALSGGTSASRVPELILEGGRGTGRPARDLTVDSGSSAGRTII